MTDQSIRERPGPAAFAAVAAVVLVTAALLIPGADASLADATDIVAAVSRSNIEETIGFLESLGSREFHLDTSAQAAEYIHDSFVDMGLDVEYQSFELDGVTVSNVVATIPGTTVDGEVYLFGAHYDSENSQVDTLLEAQTISAPGADDDASGVAAVLEIARVMVSAGPDLECTLKFVAFGAEEMGYDNTGGLVGSSYFVQQEVQADVAYAGSAILDMVGYRDGTENIVSLIKNHDEEPLAGAVERAVDEFGLDISIDQYTAPDATYSDHAPFWAVGYPSMLLIEEMEPEQLTPVNPYYHTSGDTLLTLSTEQVTLVSMALVGGVLDLTWQVQEEGVPTGIIVAGAVAAVGATAVLAYYRRQGRSEQ